MQSFHQERHQHLVVPEGPCEIVLHRFPRRCPIGGRLKQGVKNGSVMGRVCLGCDVGDDELVHHAGVGFGERHHRFAPHAVSQEICFRHAMKVHECPQIGNHVFVAVFAVMRAFAMVSGIQHPHVLGQGVSFAQALPIVGTAEQPVQDEQRGLARVGGSRQVPGVQFQGAQVAGWLCRHARYWATALAKPTYKASAIKACPMLTSANGCT